VASCRPFVLPILGAVAGLGVWGVVLAEAPKSLFDVDPLSGEEMEQILRRAYTTPKALVQRAAEFNGSGGP
jgi:hypothetical protein